MSDLLDQLVKTASYMNKYLQQDIAISISDTEKYIALYETNTMKFPFRLGSSIRESGYGEVLDRLAKTGDSIVNYVPKEITGTVPIKSIVSPIIQDKQLLGYYSVSINVEKEHHIEKSSVELMETIEHANHSIHQMTASAMQLDELMKMIEDECKVVETSIAEGCKAIELIQGISSQSNLLGLNAAIEAARVGSAGMGFSIVASEMRKLAEESKKIAEKVSKALKSIQITMNDAASRVKDAKEISIQQYYTTNEVSNSMDHIEQQSNHLVKYAKE